MDAHEGISIPVVFCHDQQGIRLLELPAAVLDTISAGHNPTLSIKSALPSAEGVGGLSSSHAVLCTDTQTFQLRQVHSSNSILLLKSPATASSDHPPALSVIASPKSTLELHKVATPVIPHLEEALAVYHGPLDDGEESESMDVSPSHHERTKKQIFEDVPASNQECEEGWVELCAFEHRGVAYRPAALALVAVWKAIYSAAALEGINLCGQVDVDLLWRVMEDDGYPRPLLQAVLAKLALQTTTNNDTKTKCSIDRSKCVPWVGVTILRSRHLSQQSTNLTRFLSEWTDFVPEAWKTFVDLESIKVALLRPLHVPWLIQNFKGHYSKSTPTTITYAEDLAGSRPPETNSTTRPKTTSSGRKWHEKFRSGAKP